MHAPSSDTPLPGHIPVLVTPIMDLFAPQPGLTMLDATVGRGGHAAAIIPRLGPGGTYIGLDMDAGNADFARQRVQPIADQVGVELKIIHANFAGARATLDQLGIDAVDLVLADLGFASTQMDDPQRGLSFQASGPLDMRLDPSLGQTAADLVNTLAERDLADIIFQLGEERYSRRIAKRIVDQRPLVTTDQLADICRAAYGPTARRSPIHPATRTFMALRIAVNGELMALDALLADLPRLLAPGARAGIISFHSLEDRRVKHTFRDWKSAGRCAVLTKKPVEADPEEAAINPRARSAKLRVMRWGETI